MSFFLAGSSAGFSPSTLAGCLSSSSSSSSSSTTTLSSPDRLDAKGADSPLPRADALALADALDIGSWAGWQVLEWPADIWDLGDSPSALRPGSPLSSLSKMLPLDDDDGGCDRPLAERQPRVGSLKRKRELFEDQPEADTGHAAVRRSLALVQPGADNLRALANVLASDVASDLTPAQARAIGRELGLQLGGGEATAGDRDRVIAGLMRAALAYPTGSAALGALARELGETLRGSAERISFSYVDALFTEAALLSLAPLADAGLVPGRPDASARLGPLKVVLEVLREPTMSAQYLTWFRASLAAWVMPPLPGDAQDYGMAQRALPVRLLGALARAFVEEGDTQVGHALSVDFLDALGALDDLDDAQGCEWLVEGLAGNPGRALGLLITLTPQLQPAAAKHLQAWMASGQLWAGEASSQTTAGMNG